MIQAIMIDFDGVKVGYYGREIEWLYYLFKNIRNVT